MPSRSLPKMSPGIGHGRTEEKDDTVEAFELVFRRGDGIARRLEPSIVFLDLTFSLSTSGAGRSAA